MRIDAKGGDNGRCFRIGLETARCSSRGARVLSRRGRDGRGRQPRLDADGEAAFRATDANPA